MEEITLNKNQRKWFNNVPIFGFIVDNIKYIGTVIYLVYYLSRPIRYYKIEYISDEREKEKIYKLRYHLYCEVYHLLSEGDYLNKLETDEYDKFSDQFAVYDRAGKMIGTFRMIRNSSIGFPTEKEYDLKLSEEKKKNMVEISRVMVSPGYKKTMLFIDILKAINLYSKKNNVKYWLGCGEQWFLNGLKSLFSNMQMIGDGKFCFNAINYPFLYDVVETSEIVKKKKYLLYYYFNKQSKKNIVV